MTNEAINIFKIEAPLERIDTFTSKGGKEILTLVFRTDGSYPQMIPIKVFGRLVNEANAWRPGAVLRVEGRLGGRDYNGRVYGDNVATRVDVISGGGSQQTEPGSRRDERASEPQGRMPDDDSVPF